MGQVERVPVLIPVKLDPGRGSPGQAKPFQAM